MKNSILLLLLFLNATGYAKAPQDSTKRSYILFHPVPKNLMRSFEMDRPDVTESAFTVDAGHFQYETDLIKSDHSSEGGIKTTVNQFNVFNLKAGITNSLDVQFVLESFINEKITDGNTIENVSGMGNITVRAKQNLWGNDCGKTAMAIIPFINIPKGMDQKITGGLIVPFAVTLANDCGLGTQFRFDFENKYQTAAYHVNLLASATISHPLFWNFNFFAESVIYRETELKINEYFINTGLIYEWKKNLKLDTGVYYGLKQTSSKIYFIGLSFRY